MAGIMDIPQNKPGRLERFGLYYLNLFNRLDSAHSVFDISDETLTKKVRQISNKGMILSSLIGIVCVFPTVYVDVLFSKQSFPVHYGWVAGVTLLSIAVEFYVLFFIALRAVFEVSELINMHATQQEFMQDSAFGVKNILARTALEIPDPELKILGIDPFKRVSKRNLLLLGLLYKAKIFVSNLVLKNGLALIFGPVIAGVSVLYEAIPVEAFWNSVVIRRVVHEARLRLFGFALANQIANNLRKDQILDKLSHVAKVGCLRAVGNAVVMTRNYHPNMVILLLRFQELVQIKEHHKYDDWNLFLDTLSKVTPDERYFLLDLFTVSAAFDGRLSRLESENLRAAYGKDYALYQPRLVELTHCLRTGKLNAALALCKLDFIPG